MNFDELEGLTEDDIDVLYGSTVDMPHDSLIAVYDKKFHTCYWNYTELHIYCKTWYIQDNRCCSVGYDGTGTSCTTSDAFFNSKRIDNNICIYMVSNYCPNPHSACQWFYCCR